VVADKTLIFDANSFANEGVTRNLASFADINTPLNLNECANSSTASDYATVQVYKPMNLHVFA
jgi:hypothetical protein